MGIDVAVTLEATLQPDDLADQPEQALDAWLSEQLVRAGWIAQAGAGTMHLLVVEDAAMAEAHEQYCGVPGTTDVITFDHRDTEDDPLEGDLILCLDEARRQARARGHAVRVELLLYAVHGLLHLLGEDDHEEAAYQQMHRREDEIMAALGLGKVFHTDPDEGST